MIYGYSSNSVSESELLQLREVSFCEQAETLESIAAFLTDMATKIKNGGMETSHEHMNKCGNNKLCEIVVLNPNFNID